MKKDLVVVGGRRKTDPPTLLLFGCDVQDDEITADAYLVLEPLRKGRKPRLQDLDGRVLIEDRLEPGFVRFKSITFKRCS